MLNWGIIGPGRIAGTFIRALQVGTSGRPLIVLGRDPERTRRFAAEHGVPESTANLRTLLLDPRIDAVYVATPHISHAELSIAALKMGKPVLCEKPMALSAADTEAVLAASRESGKLFLEGFMYRWHPQTAKLVELLRAGVVGEINMIESTFGFASKYDPASRLFDPALGGGAVWDIGCYPLSMAMLVAGAALGREPGVPDRFIADGVTAPGNIDLSSCAIAVWDGRIVAQLSCSLGATLGVGLRIHGSSGRIVVPNPWVCNRTDPEEGLIRIERDSGCEEIRVPAAQTSYGYEADGFARLLSSGAREAVSAPFSVAESRALTRLLSDWVAAITG